VTGDAKQAELKSGFVADPAWDFDYVTMSKVEARTLELCRIAPIFIFSELDDNDILSPKSSLKMISVYLFLDLSVRPNETAVLDTRKLNKI